MVLCALFSRICADWRGLLSVAYEKRTGEGIDKEDGKEVQTVSAQQRKEAGFRIL